MNKLIVFLAALFLTTGCTKVSNYVASIISVEEKKEVEKANPLCPADKPKALVVEGVCDGSWSYSYDSASKVYTCSYAQKAAVTCPPGSVSIGQPSGCGGQVEQYTKKTVANNATCDKLFADAVKVSYRLVCCI